MAGQHCGGVLAGIDVGTTSVKVLLMGEDGTELAVGRAPTPWHEVDADTESTAEELASAAQAALADALRQRPDDRVVAIGVASMAESGVLTDDDDQPVAPVIAWHDTRDEAELRALEQDLGETFCARSGLPLWTQWSLTKHRWLREHHPETARATRRYSIAEWVVRRLGGDRSTEPSLAARTGWLDLHTHRLWPDTLDWAGASASLFAELTPAGRPVGSARLSGSLAAAHEAVLTVAGHDHQVAAVGLGLHHPGDEFDSCGTAEALLRAAEVGLPEDVVAGLARDGVTVGAHAAPQRWCLLGATQGGRVLGAVMDALGCGRDDLARLDKLAEQAREVPDAVMLGRDGSDVELDPQATPGEVWRAATVAVSRQAAALSERMSTATVSPSPGAVVVAGGWAHSEAFMRAKRELVGDVRVPQTDEAGCRGAALFAGVAAGLYRDLDDTPAAGTA